MSYDHSKLQSAFWSQYGGRCLCEHCSKLPDAAASPAIPSPTAEQCDGDCGNIFCSAVARPTESETPRDEDVQCPRCENVDFCFVCPPASLAPTEGTDWDALILAFEDAVRDGGQPPRVKNEARESLRTAILSTERERDVFKDARQDWEFTAHRYRDERDEARTFAPPNAFGAHTIAALVEGAAEYKAEVTRLTAVVEAARAQHFEDGKSRHRRCDVCTALAALTPTGGKEEAE